MAANFPAFPGESGNKGISFRDLVFCHVIQGLCANPEVYPDFELLVADAWRITDESLEARDKFYAEKHTKD